MAALRTTWWTFVGLILCFAKVVAGGLEITLGPANVTVNEGDSATFPCQHQGTRREPVWFIRGDQYTLDNLPPRHYHSGGNVTIYSVQPSDNGSTYQCTFFTVSSDVATLTVAAPEGEIMPTTVAASYNATPSGFPSSSAQHTLNSTSMHSLVLHVPASDAFPINSANDVVTVVAMEEHTLILVSVGTVCTLAAIGVICAIGCILCLLKKRRGNERIYEDVGPPLQKSDFVFKVNSCYEQHQIYAEIDEDAVDLKENDAYSKVGRCKEIPDSPSPQPSNTSADQSVSTLE